MAKVPGTFYTAETQRKGATPVSPPNADDDPQGPINGATVPPVAKRYTSHAIMIADQNNQLEGYLYFDGTDNWWYNGGTSGTISDYEAFGGGVAVYPEMDVRENNQLLFNKDYSTGIEASARTGNITVSFTGAQRGAVTVMRHNDSSEPSYPSQNIIITGEYIPSEDNYLFFILVNKSASTEIILCTIHQDI